MAKYRNGAERSSPAAQTSGSALGVFLFSSRLTCTPLATPSTPVTQVMAPKIKLSEKKQRQVRITTHVTSCQVCYLSEDAQLSATHGVFSSVKTAARNRKVGAQSAKDPVTNATAVKPSVDSTKLWLHRNQRQEVPHFTIFINSCPLHS